MRLKKHLETFYGISKEFGLSTYCKMYVIPRLKGLSANHRDLERSFVVGNYLWTHYKYVFSNNTFPSNTGPVKNNTIWIFWWQGEDKMPYIVKTCYESVLKYAPKECEVVLLTKDNIQDYWDIPNHISSSAPPEAHACIR